eukprot:6201571-Pleurochrysis_carterae.AAC.5
MLSASVRNAVGAGIRREIMKRGGNRRLPRALHANLKVFTVCRLPRVGYTLRKDTAERNSIIQLLSTLGRLLACREALPLRAWWVSGPVLLQAKDHRSENEHGRAPPQRARPRRSASQRRDEGVGGGGMGGGVGVRGSSLAVGACSRPSTVALPQARRWRRRPPRSRDGTRGIAPGC